MSTTREERDTRVHQVVFRWTDQHLLGGRGIGPVGTSLEQRDLARWSDLLDNGDLVGPLRPDRPALGLLRLRSRPEYSAVVRVDTVPTSSRGSHQAHVLVGPADVLTARTALGLRDWDGWQSPEDGSLPDPALPPLDADPLIAACVPPGRPDPGEVAALLRHVLHHPDYHFHFAGASSDSYALAFGLASLLDVSLVVEGDVHATAAQPRIVVTEEKTTLHIPPSRWYRKSPASRAPLEEQAADITHLVDEALGDPPRVSPKPPQDLVRGLAGLRHRREGLYPLLLRAVRGDAQARAHLTQDNTLEWVREQLPRLKETELTHLCRSWRGWSGADARLAALLRDQAAESALDWEDTTGRDTLRDAAEKLFSHPSPLGVSPEREDELQAVRRRLAALWTESPGRSPDDVAALLWQAFTLARLSRDELHDLLGDLNPSTGLLVLVADRFAGRHEAEEVRRGLLDTLLARRVSPEERAAFREALLGTGFLLEVLAEEDPDARRQLFAHLLRGAYGSAGDNRVDPERPWRLYEDLRAVVDRPGFHFVLPAVANTLGDVEARLRLWCDLRGTPAARETAALLDGVPDHLMGRLAESRSLAEFREALDMLVELRRFDALPERPLAEETRRNAYFQQMLYRFRKKHPEKTSTLDVVRAFADLIWLSHGQLPDPYRDARLTDAQIRELEKAELPETRPFFLIALLSVSRTRDEPTPATERLWRKFSEEQLDTLLRRPKLVELTGEPPTAAPAPEPLWRSRGREKRRDPREASPLPVGPDSAQAPQSGSDHPDDVPDQPPPKRSRLSGFLPKRLGPRFGKNPGNAASGPWDDDRARPEEWDENSGRDTDLADDIFGGRRPDAASRIAPSDEAGPQAAEDSRDVVAVRRRSQKPSRPRGQDSKARKKPKREPESLPWRRVSKPYRGPGPVQRTVIASAVVLAFALVLVALGYMWWQMLSI